MPYIVVKVGGYINPNGNGSLWIDGFPHSHVKNGKIIYVSAGPHSVKYVPTLKGSEWTASANFTQNTVMDAFVINENYSAPNFSTHIADPNELLEIEAKVEAQNNKNKAHKAKDKKMTWWYVPRCIIGILIVIAGLYVTFTYKQPNWEDCILPSALIAVGGGLIMSFPVDAKVYFTEIAKGLFAGVGWFGVMVVINFLGKLLGF